MTGRCGMTSSTRFDPTFAASDRRCRWAPTRERCFGWMSKRPIPDALLDSWLEPATTQAQIRGDLRKHAGDTKQGRRDLLEAKEHLSSFNKPVLVTWAAEDK